MDNKLLKTLDKLNQDSLEEMYRDTLALWNDAENSGRVRLAEYYDDLMNEIELRLEPIEDYV